MALARLRNVLANLYSTEQRARMIAYDADLDTARIAFGQSAQDYWHAILIEAGNVNRFDKLVSIALGEYGRNQELQEAWQGFQQSREADTVEPTLKHHIVTQNKLVDIFLAYSHQDIDLMERLYAHFEDAGFGVWAAKGLEPGTPSWTSAIEQAIQQARCMVVILSPDAKSSQWVNNEIHYAQLVNLHIFPVLAKGDVGGAVPLNLLTSQWVDIRREYQMIDTNLIPALRRHLNAPEPTIEEEQPAAVAEKHQNVALDEGTAPSPTEIETLQQQQTWQQRMSHRNLLRMTVFFLIIATVSIGSYLWIFKQRTWTNPKDGAVYVKIPAGEFLMGGDGEEQTVNIPEFWIMQTEVTNEQYSRCVLAQVCTPPNNVRWSNPEYANHPVTNVNWHQANQYASWTGGRLPTETEWEKACRGTDGRIYPWGNESPDAGRLNFAGSNANDTVEVATYPSGANRLYDMAGNVWEWMSDKDASDVQSLRGGSWNNEHYVRCAYQNPIDPYDSFSGLGFRVVMSAPGVDKSEPTGAHIPQPTPTVTDKPTSSPTFTSVVMPATPTTTTVSIAASTPQTDSIRINPQDGAVYVYVPAGEFMMGSTERDRLVQDDEKLQHPVSVDGFWIMKTEVTNSQYKRCVDANICAKPNNNRWNISSYATHPATHIDWNQATIYAMWVGGRLPTEAEWEKACRWDSQKQKARIYPWGDEAPNDSLLNYNRNVGDTTPVGRYSPKGDSPYGLVDMAGNAWEWTSSIYKPYPYDPEGGREDPEDPSDRVLRGGSWYYIDVDVVRCANRLNNNPNFNNNYSIGFRVVMLSSSPDILDSTTYTLTPTATNIANYAPSPTSIHTISPTISGE